MENDIMTFSQTRHYNTRRRGFTLAEAMMATVVLGIAAAGVLLPFTSGATVQAEGMRRTLGAKLASDLLQEIVNTPFNQIIAGYGSYSEAEGQVKNAGGVVFTDSNYARLSRNSICNYVYVPQESGTGVSKFILVTVRVFYSGKEIAIISRLVSE
ncbi:MAG: type IV pilus modification PilV family protein [Planctomycetota bacterium]|jgi:prepilin-type N-terminal cleavage/methylation domain-containing protein